MFFVYEYLNCFKVKWCLFVLKCGSFFARCLHPQHSLSCTCLKGGAK